MLQIAQRSPYGINAHGKLVFRYHPGQKRVMQARERFILALAGTQGGKTTLGAWWLLREIARAGPGDYLVAAPMYGLMQKKVLPEFIRLFQTLLGLGRYRASERAFLISQRGARFFWPTLNVDVRIQPTTIFFGHAQDPDSLESATALAAWLDEAGQRKFRVGSWEAIQRRLSVHQGRVLLTTTPYTLGWLKTQLHDRAATDPDIALIQFDSTMNPNFPREEYERMSALLPAWKFNMMYRGIFERPAGMIYDCFDRRTHTTPRFTIPESWPRFTGHDFGGVNMVAVYAAREPGTLRYYVYRVYQQANRTIEAHAHAILDGEPHIPTAIGGAPSEDQWRDEFTERGLPVARPDVADIEVGINRLYSMLKAQADGRDSIASLVLFDDLDDLIDDFESYARELDDFGNPTEEIEDKSTYHRLDGLRYLATRIAEKNDSDPVLVYES